MSEPAAGGSKQWLTRRLLAVYLVAWLPLFLISLIEGNAWGGVRVPFLDDIATQVKLLFALPLLFIAEQVLSERLHKSIPKFIERGIVPMARRAEFEATLIAARKWLDSNWIGLALLVAAYAIAFTNLWRHTDMMATGTWYGAIENGKFVATWAGWWFALVSLPVFQFFLLRWYVRLLAWWRMLAEISRMDLNLQPLHADRVGGLGFLDDVTLAFAPFLLAQGAVVSVRVAERIVFAGAQLTSFKFELAAVILVLELLVLGPLLMFSMRLARAKREALHDYGDLAMRYARDFNSKWLSGKRPSDETELGTGDIQSLADLATSFGNVQAMLAVPVQLRTALALAAAIALPMIPLLFTMFSPAELLERVVKLLM